MTQKYLLEISVQTVEAALAAERGGADRIELCSNLNVGGLTPSHDLLRAARKAVRIPIFSMIRPRAGDFVYSTSEFAEMKRSIAETRECGMDGVVLGILTKDNRVDVARTQELVEIATPLPVTYHRAFDETVDLRQGLEDVIQAGARRILTSGGAATALAGAALLAELVAAAADRIVILPGAGISATNIAEVVRCTSAREFHSGLSSVLPYSTRDFARFEAEAAKLASHLATSGR